MHKAARTKNSTHDVWERLQLRKHQPPASQCSHAAGTGTAREGPQWFVTFARSLPAAASLPFLCTPLLGRVEGMQGWTPSAAGAVNAFGWVPRAAIPCRFALLAIALGKDAHTRQCHRSDPTKAPENRVKEERY